LRDGGSPKPRDGRRKILDAALELFAAQGFDATTVREIAERVGMSDAALYYYFKNKREILTSLWDVPSMDEAETDPGREFTPERLDELTEMAIRFTVANDRLIRLTCREALSGDQTASALRLRNRSFLRRVLYEHFLTVVPADVADIRTEAVMALLTGATMRAQMEAGPDFATVASSPEFVEQLRRRVRLLAHLEEARAG